MIRLRISSRLPALLCSVLLVSNIACAEPAKFKPDISNPLTATIHHSMEQRHSRLVKFYEPGAIGLANDGMVAKSMDTSKIKMGTLQIIEKLIDAENEDRRQLLAAVAQANGRGSGKDTDLTEARAAWLVKWRASMQSGWMIQDDVGNWVKKP